MRDRHPEGPGSGTRSATYRIVPMPPDRRNTADYLDLYWWKHTIYALLEVDVTDARALIAAYESRSGEAISFTGYLTHCLARAVAEDTSVQACRQGRRNLAVFDDVDVFLPVERETDGATVAVPHIIRAANRKELIEIHREIRAAQTGPVPAGTVGVTALGMAGRRGGWGLAPAGQSLLLVVGGIGRKPGVVGDRVEPRDILDVTLAFDHDVVDGAPAARFVRRLVDLVESGYGLHDLAVGHEAGRGAPAPG